MFGDVSMEGIMGGESIDWAVLSVQLGGTIVDKVGWVMVEQIQIVQVVYCTAWSLWSLQSLNF